MAKNKIYTVGFDLPGNEFQYVDFNSDTTLLDADIVLYEPTLGSPQSVESYNGRALLTEHASFIAKQRLDHWRSEIVGAVNAGKLVIVFLRKPKEYYRHTGEKQYSGTGRSRTATRIVTSVSSYDAVPNIKVVSKTGSEIKLDREAKFLSPYWAEFSKYSPYEVEISGEFNTVLSSRSGDRAVGAMIASGAGQLLLLPPLQYNEDEFLKYDGRSKQHNWTPEALKFGKRLVATLGALSATLKGASDATPAPDWTEGPEYRLALEAQLEFEISNRAAAISALQLERDELTGKLSAAGGLRRLLYEQGKPLEAAIIEALRLLGFDANPFENGESEFDCVFESDEGRCIGEAEGKDNKAINIDKFSQLERNLQEDFARESVTSFAKGALFGNAYRLSPLHERSNFFTEKCLSAAKRVGAALIRTPDLFEPAKYLQEHPEDAGFAQRCRQAIFEAEGTIVVFPLSAIAGETVLDLKLDPTNEEDVGANGKSEVGAGG
ncbi:MULTISPECIES: hypothetical protein [Burkholderia]|uniref:hypothetical protein n=1 Tax=Burkholderia TaxID=32008 RepID=UPI000F59CF75|nr:MULTISPECIES: hypothetical protein [Burkholderia]MBN3741215.1 hypothetical protein [Burkholderia sp. Tr-20355]